MLRPAPPLMGLQSCIMQRSLSFILVAVVSSTIYLNCLECDFVFDDHRAILTNDDLDVEKTSLWELFYHDFWGGPMWRKESHKSYRPLTVLTYRYLNHYITGLSPYSYHLVNVLFNMLASWLFLLVVETVLGETGEWPTFAALLFTTHSIHTESVASVVGRAELLSAVFFFLSFLAYVKAVKQLTLMKQWMYLLLTVLLAACSMLSKEPGITILGICVGYDVLLHWSTIWKFQEHEEVVRNGGGMHLKAETKTVNRGIHLSKFHLGQRLGLLIVSGIALIWFRLAMNYGGEPIFKPEEMKAAFHPNRTVRILSFSNIYAWNVWLLLAPSPLCCDWSLGSIPIVQTFHDIRNIWSVLLYLSITMVSLYTLKSERYRVPVGMSLSFMLIPFLPSTGIIIKVGFVIAERILYVPSAGFCMLVVIGAKKITQFTGKKKLVHVMLIYLILIMSIKTISRNLDWKSDLSLFESGTNVNPKNVKLQNNYAMELKSAEQLEKSKKHYLKAIEVEPDYSEVYFNYGNLLSEMGDYEGAAKNFEKAISYPQMYSKTLNNLATTYFRLGRHDYAEKRFLESLELNPDQPMTYNNLASLYGENNRLEESEKMFRKAMELNPNYTEAYFNLGTLLYKMGRIKEAEENLKHALKLNPRHHGALNNLNVIEFYKNQEKQ